MAGTAPPRSIPAPAAVAVARIAPFGAWILAMVLASPTGPLASVVPGWAAALGDWGYALRVLASVALLAWFWRGYTELRGPSARLRPGDWVAAAGVGLVVLAAWVAVGPLVRVGEVSTAVPGPQDPAAWALWLAFRLAGTALVVPLVEELFWRSWLMRRIDSDAPLELAPQQVSWLAVVVSSAVFALEHRELLASLLAGLAFAWLYRRTGRLWAPVVAHAATNAGLAGFVLWTGRYEFW